MGSLLPVAGSTPKFSQLYIYDTENEVSNRKNAIRSGRDQTCSNDDAVDPQVINDIKNLLDSCNPLVISYRMARDRFIEDNQQNVKLKLIGRREKDGRTYNLPNASEVAGIVIGDVDASFDKRDIVVETQSVAQDCYRIGIKRRGVSETSTSTRTDVTMREFFAYIIQDRVNEYSLLLNARKLFQQFLVDGYTMIESQSTYASDTGKSIRLPSSFTGGSRYMLQNYMDAMAICKWFGYPDLFITVTCNPKWPEITRFLNDKDLNPEDRPEILCRLFKVKLDQMIKDLKKDKLFGSVKAVIYTETSIELYVLRFRDKENGLQLFQLVSDFMIHGPCGVNNPTCPCMRDGKCSKRFPRDFVNHTSLDEDGYPIYRRRDNGYIVEKGGIALDNRYVVPYNRPDRVTAAVYKGNKDNSVHGTEAGVDEIKEEIIVSSSCLPGEQNIVYEDDADLCDVLNKPTVDTLSKPDFVWTMTWKYLSDDVLYKQRITLKKPDLQLEPEVVKNLALFVIEQLLRRNGSTLRNMDGMPYPDNEYILSSTNSVMYAVEMGDGGMFFLYGYGGTRKTFIWKTLSAALRSKGEIVLNVASSGIAALLLSGGRTAHSRFAIPINIHEESFCSINPNSDLAALIKKAKLIIWDETPMIHKHCFEALDRTLRDILRLSDPSNEEKLIGGKVVVFGGDFRQILPVIPKGNLDEIKEFGEWILKIGNGTVGEHNDGESIVEILDDILIKESTDPVASIISFVYPNVVQKLSDRTYFQDKAILAPTLEVVDVINDRVLSMIPGDETVYLSSDSICESDQATDTNAAVFSPDFLNSLKFSGLPNHKLILKVGVIIMLLWNIDQPNGLCNGTRLQVVRLDKHVIEAKIRTGSNIGDTTLITRQKMNPSDKRIRFKVVRRQFPIAVCFAMTINKSQGQSLARVGLFLPRPVSLMDNYMSRV
nr:hypothetical protein [Tanacetum cinerariifolium]